MSLLLIVLTSCNGNQPALQAQTTSTEPFKPYNEISSTPIPKKSPILTWTQTPLSMTSLPTTTPTIPKESVVPTLSVSSSVRLQSNPTLLPDLPTGRIFVWDYSRYGYLNPTELQDFIQPITIKDTAIRNPQKARWIAFANHSEQIAYLFDGSIYSLWISDVWLTKPNSVWIDREGWLGVPSGYDQPTIWWGINDQFVFVNNNNAQVVYSLKQQTALPLSGNCGKIGLSPITNAWAVWCPVKTTDIQKYAILELDGTQNLADSLPVRGLIDAKDWAFSQDGSSLLYADLDGKLYIANRDSKPTQLPVNYEPPRQDTGMRVFQWSLDGKRFLVYAKDQGAGICPSLDNHIPPCWIVFDAGSRKLVWQTGNNKFLDPDATLSPDGKWLAIFDQHFSPGGYVFEIETGKNTLVYSWGVVAAVYWGK
jgi:hypothetical protein